MNIARLIKTSTDNPKIHNTKPRAKATEADRAKDNAKARDSHSAKGKDNRTVFGNLIVNSNDKDTQTSRLML